MRLARQFAMGAALLATTATSMAHEGHGMIGGSHWHPADTSGVALVALLAALAVWLARGE